MTGLLDHGPRRPARPHRRRAHRVRTAPTSRARRARRGARCAATAIAMIFQDPMMTLNPVLRIDTQMVEAVLAHHADVARKRARALPARRSVRVGIASPDERLRSLSAPVLRRHAPARGDRHRAASTGPTSSSPTSPRPRSTSRSRARSSSRCRSSAARAARRSSGSPTTCR